MSTEEPERSDPSLGPIRACYIGGRVPFRVSVEWSRIRVSDSNRLWPSSALVALFGAIILTPS